MAKKRLRKKQAKKQLQTVLKNKGYSQKQINKLDLKSLENITTKIISEDKKKEKELERKKKRRTQQKNLHERKKKLLIQLGAIESKLTENQTKRIKLNDILSRNVTAYTHPHLFPVYKIKDNKAFYFAFLDYTGEEDLSVLIARNNRLNDKELYIAIQDLLMIAPSYERGKSASSGKAGTYEYMYDTIENIRHFHSDIKTLSRKKYLAKHKRSRISHKHIKGYQELWNKDKQTNYFDEFTIHSILVIALTFMENITEEEREVFYQNFFSDLSESIEEVYDLLPFPYIREGYY